MLIYVHGLRMTHQDVIESHRSLYNNMLALQLQMPFFSKVISLLKYWVGYSMEEAYSSHCPYDAIIGYSWPSFNHAAYYYKAKENATNLAPKFAQEIAKITAIAKKTDIMAHSMGNLIVFEALSKHARPEISIDHVYSIAAALPHDCLSVKMGYQKALERCRNLFIFHSKNDSALNWPYYIVESSSLALGLIGPKLIADNSSKVKVINASDVIKGHSDYISSDKFYNYLLKIHNNELDFTENHFILS